MTEPITVLLVDDHPVYREGLELLLGSIEGLQVIGSVGDGAAAVEAAAALHPDVIVMDIQMPGVDGIEATRRIVGSGAEARIVMLTMSDDDEAVLHAMRTGARGYLLKAAGQDDIAQAIRTVATGGVVFGAALAGRIAEFFARGGVGAGAGDAGAEPGGAAGTPRGDGAPNAFPQLTAREREILALLAEGRTNPQIAATLYLSPKTVRNNVSAILMKLQAADRHEAARVARDAGFGRG